ncbi:RHTO0S21e02498g1_1 [Rhodotorula toruloides]|uniref:Cytidine deaminase n=1 Tax=Rhodotorula toruloides TaxID=5286 RepID=A0A061BPH1_RHOTO|nr:RHTO0S21e02498g1_1 [Rhodotorula toruloides]
MVVYTPLPLSPSNRKTLISSALSARDGSYSPYSNFRVGACLLTDEGEFVSGANVECASYGGAICAERTAIVKGVSEGKRRFVALAVTSDVNGMVSPCGICRQVLREFCPLEMPVLLIPSSYVEGKTPTKTATEAEGADTEDTVVETTMGELLPLSFGPEDLRKPRPGAGEGKA